MYMRIKASDTLKRLKKLKNKKRKSVVFSEELAETWHKVETPDDLQGYIRLVSWCNKNVSKKYTRGQGAFWFEDEKDAFKFELRWGSKNG